MDYQLLFNLAFGALTFLMGFLVNNIWSEIKGLRDADQIQSNRIGGIELLVAGQYVRQEKFDRTMEQIFQKLNEIRDEMHKKADRN